MLAPPPLPPPDEPAPSDVAGPVVCHESKPSSSLSPEHIAAYLAGVNEAVRRVFSTLAKKLDINNPPDEKKVKLFEDTVCYLERSYERNVPLDGLGKTVLKPEDLETALVPFRESGLVHVRPAFVRSESNERLRNLAAVDGTSMAASGEKSWVKGSPWTVVSLQLCGTQVRIAKARSRFPIFASD